MCIVDRFAKQPIETTSQLNNQPTADVSQPVASFHANRRTTYQPERINLRIRHFLPLTPRQEIRPPLPMKKELHMFGAISAMWEDILDGPKFVSEHFKNIWEICWPSQKHFFDTLTTLKVSKKCPEDT